MCNKKPKLIMIYNKKISWKKIWKNTKQQQMYMHEEWRCDTKKL